MKEFSQIDLSHGYDNRFIVFQELMRYRIRDILLVSSLYDSFILGEEGGLYELLLGEYLGLNLSHTPGITRAASGSRALKLATSDARYDLIVVTLHLEDMHVLDFAEKLRAAGVKAPIVLLTYDNRELSDLKAKNDLSCFDKVFMWQGNFRILVGIIKCIEDLRNVERDTRLAGVQSIILIEDNVKFYSSYLPIIYTQLMRHSQDVIGEGINLSHKILRMRARPKILLCHTYDEAWAYYETYHATVLGVISDVSFPRDGENDERAGIEFARQVKATHPDIPILLQSNDETVREEAEKVNASFLRKSSPRLLHRVKTFMRQYLSFGDFVFFMPDGTEVDRAHDLRGLEDKLHIVPGESIRFHAERNHFSNWLKARTEFYLAHKLRPQKVTDFPSTEGVREALISAIQDYHVEQHRGKIVDFHPATFNPDDNFTSIGQGSLGGKGRGLVFLDSLLNLSQVQKKFEGIDIAVPPSVVIRTDVFDHFMEQNDLLGVAVESTADEEIVNRFLDAEFPMYAMACLRDLLKVVDYPLAVRSSSLLEDSQYLPFAGVYETYMVPNNNDDLDLRLEQLINAIKRVYASTFTKRAKGYIKATPYLLEEEKMGVVIQKLVGKMRGDLFYPDFAGVVRSYNFYPAEPMESKDGIASVALGLGSMVVEGGMATRFCPKYPRHMVQFADLEDQVIYAQKEFYALALPPPDEEVDPREKTELTRHKLDVAEKDGVLGPLGSTFSAENDAIYDGISRAGMRLVSFSAVLKNNFFPLAGILQKVTQIGRWGMSGPVEVEFSANLGEPSEFRLLQLRPMVIRHEQEQLVIGEVDQEQLVCKSHQVLGNGVIDGIRDVLLVDPDRFDRSKTVEVAGELGTFNLELTHENLSYLLIGIGRLGTADPWLGIPVTWDDITGARLIVETEFRDIKVMPSQGTHFFQNLNAFQVGYFTVDVSSGRDYIDWKWLLDQPIVKKREYTRHVRLESPLSIKMNGRSSEGIILKPESK